MLPSFARQTITVIEPGSVVDHGTAVANWATATETVVTGCSVQPVQGSENNDNRSAVLTQWRVFAPAGTTCTGHARIRFGSQTYNVIGPSQDWIIGQGRVDHVEILMSVWSG